MYQVIVLGATFAAAGIAAKYQENCLVLERSTQAGYEFFGALNFGKGYETTPAREEARTLQQTLLREGFYGGDRHIYPYLQNANVLFATDILSVSREQDHFVCVTHGVKGLETFKARNVIDTRSRDIVSKTYNILVQSPAVPSFPGVAAEKGFADTHYILRIPTDVSLGYPEARKKAMALVSQFSDGQMLILSANCFDETVKAGYPKTENHIFCLPSKAWDNPALAFAAGLEVVL